MRTEAKNRKLSTGLRQKWVITRTLQLENYGGIYMKNPFCLGARINPKWNTSARITQARGPQSITRVRSYLTVISCLLLLAGLEVSSAPVTSATSLNQPTHWGNPLTTEKKQKVRGKMKLYSSFQCCGAGARWSRNYFGIQSRNDLFPKYLLN